MNRLQYFPYLDGLRAISILWVIIHHMPIPMNSTLDAFRLRGDLGVEIFFIISGFVVVQSLFSSTSLKNFYLKRIFRIIPPYFLTLLSLSAIAFFIDHTLREKTLMIKDIWSSFPLFYYNYSSVENAANVPGTLNIFWSLCFEEQFYLILGFTYLFFRKHLSKALLTIALSSILCRHLFILMNSHVDLHTLQIQTHLRLDAILMGSLSFLHLEWLEKKTTRFPLSLFLFLFAALSFFHFQAGVLNQAIIYTFTPIIIAAIVIKLKNHTSIYKKILEHPWLTVIGVCSYEIYLTHEIVLGALVRFKLNSNPSSYFLISVALSCVTGFFFHKLFSRPTNTFLRKKFLAHL